MTTFSLVFDCDNAAFEDDLYREISAVLERVARHVLNTSTHSGVCFDSNGNRVGEWDINER